MSDRKYGVSARALAGVVGAVVGLGALSAAGWQQPEGATEPAGEEAIDLAQVAALMGQQASAPAGRSNDGLRPFKDVVNGFDQVQGMDGSLYGVWHNKKTNQLIAELPRGWERQNHFFAMTVSGGEQFAGLQAADMYTQWRRINDRMALVMPQIDVRSSGDQESKDSIDTVFTDQVLLDIPLVSTGPSGQPVINLS